MNCIVFTGGGTAGHIFPGLAIAEELPKDINIVWLGSRNGLDRRLVSSMPAIKFISIPSGKYRRYFSFKNFIDIFKIVYSFFVAFFILLRLRPILLFSKGGFVSTPPCVAAYLLHIPVITHECDASPGLATRLNSFFATKILISYPDTVKFFPPKHRRKVIYTGNPVRSIFYNATGEKTKDFLGEIPSKPLLLVLGGSLGAQQINELIYKHIHLLLQDFFIVHQTGGTNIKRARQLLEELRNSDCASSHFYCPCAFIKEELPDLIASASIVISRSGSNTVWELATLGATMLLIPLEKGSSRGDQIENALFFSSKKAAITLREAMLKDDLFIKTINMLKNDDALRISLHDNAKKLANVNVVKNIVQIIEKTAKDS